MLFCPSTDQTVQGVANAAALILCHSTRWCDWKKQLILPWHLLRDVFWILWGCNPSYSIGHRLLCHYHLPLLLCYRLSAAQSDVTLASLSTKWEWTVIWQWGILQCIQFSLHSCLNEVLCLQNKGSSLILFFWSGRIMEMHLHGKHQATDTKQSVPWHLHNLSKLRPK